MKTLIIYKGRYGATQQYAEWIGEELNTAVLASHNCGAEQLAEADTLIIGSSVYIGTVVIKDWVKENLKILSGKSVFLFIVCGTPVNEKEKLNAYVQSSLPEEFIKRSHIYFLPGKLNYKKLSLFDKFMLRMGMLLARKTGVKKSIFADYNEVKKENIAALVNDVRVLSNDKVMVA